MNVSDLIEACIKEMIDSGDGSTELKRNELAGQFHCVPSQINYVISTRFTSERGYLVDSRRGGGGCITIRRIGLTKNAMLMHVINCIGDEIDYPSASACINNLRDSGIMSSREAGIISTAMSDKVLVCPPQTRDKIRAGMLKNMLLHFMG